MAITTGVSYQFYSDVTRGPLLQLWKKVTIVLKASRHGFGGRSRQKCASHPKHLASKVAPNALIWNLEKAEALLSKAAGAIASCHTKPKFEALPPLEPNYGTQVLWKLLAQLHSINRLGAQV